MALNWDDSLEPARALADRDSHIIIGRDGTVLAITDDWPQHLVDTRLEDCQGLPHQVLEAARILLQRSHHSGGRVDIETAVLNGGARTVRLVLVESLPMRRRKTDVRALLASKLAVLVSQAAAVDVALTVVVADDVPEVVQLDAEKVAWAVTTLVGNALRYVQSGSHRMSGRTINVRAGFNRSGSQLRIEVADNGLGIPSDTVARLFKRDGLNVRGAGLSLLLMADICAAHGGTIEVRSENGLTDHGTIVRLTFPV